MTTSAPRRGALTALDQGLSSLSNFAVALYVARVSGPTGLGAFTTAFAVWLLIAGVHRSLITDPMIMRVDGHGDIPARLARGMAAEVWLGAACTVVVLTGGIALGVLDQGAAAPAVLALAPWIVVLLVQDYWRWMGFLTGQAGRSLANDGVFVVVQACALVALFATGHRSATAAIAGWGAGAGAGALLGFYQFGVPRSVRGGTDQLRRTWKSGRWLLAAFATGWGSTQASLIVVGVMLGAASLGVLRAAQNLMGPTSVLLQLSGSIGLPEAARAFEARGMVSLHRTSRTVLVLIASATAAYATVAVLARHTVIPAVYGDRFPAATTVVVLVAIESVITSLRVSSMMLLKTLDHTAALFVSGLVSTAVTLALVVALGLGSGLPGVALALVVGSAVHTGLAAAFARRAQWVPAANSVFEAPQLVSSSIGGGP